MFGIVLAEDSELAGQLDQLVPSGNGASVASHCAFLKFKSEMNINVCNVIVIVVS